MCVCVHYKHFCFFHSLSYLWLTETPWTTACKASLSFTIYLSLLKLMSIESLMPSKHLIFCHFLLLPDCPQSVPESGSFPMGQFFTSGGQSTGASASVLPMNIKGRFPFTLPGLISLLSKGLSRVFSRTTNQKPEFLVVQTSLQSNFMVQPYMTTGKTIALAIQSFVKEVLFLLLTSCLGFSLLLFQGVSIFKFHRCSHGLQWLWSPRK